MVRETLDDVRKRCLQTRQIERDQKGQSDGKSTDTVRCVQIQSTVKRRRKALHDVSGRTI